jgi:hypothetical protein
MRATLRRHGLALGRLVLAVQVLAPAGLGLVLTAGAAKALPGAFQSPWWENYEVRQSFLCPGQGLVVVERNDSQASILSGGVRFTLFREQAAGPGLLYSSDSMRLTLRDDELTLEQLPQRLICHRTEDA